MFRLIGSGDEIGDIGVKQYCFQVHTVGIYTGNVATYITQILQ